MRRRFGKILNELANEDKKIILIVGDIGYGIFDDFRKNHSERFYNLGICEQSLIGLTTLWKVLIKVFFSFVLP